MAHGQPRRVAEAYEGAATQVRKKGDMEVSYNKIRQVDKIHCRCAAIFIDNSGVGMIGESMPWDDFQSC